ncbi:hypothetical protein PGTUg99_004750 [Puccinia graminis f. sp. tritici]|uniref:Uncharacterized protein n=1 Tax=Puccinia graminis f. sp. tritici TaxID=56615 RepID=A0A5B0SKJ5_PUCGR|nr:hypothetical protein PGTUg99_004750 [Puccinia graminis f. sp. tritici]
MGNTGGTRRRNRRPVVLVNNPEQLFEYQAVPFGRPYQDKLGRQRVDRVRNRGSHWKTVVSTLPERRLVGHGSKKNNHVAGNSSHLGRILMLLSIGTDMKGRNFIVWTDNKTTESALRSRKSKDFHSNNEWKQIQKLLILEDLDITPLRVSLAENISNGLSRGVQRPHIAENRDLLLKALAKEDELVGKQARKLPMMLWHMTHLWKELSHGSQFDKAVLDMSIMSFWGLSRLSELSYDSELGPISFASSVLISDVIFNTENNSFASITIRNAKKGAPGKPQLITLREQSHRAGYATISLGGKQ